MKTRLPLLIAILMFVVGYGLLLFFLNPVETHLWKFFDSLASMIISVLAGISVAMFVWQRQQESSKATRKKELLDILKTELRDTKGISNFRQDGIEDSSA